ncbi:hypothetical protein ACFPYN_02975 [Paenisporosarcina macmurdoensis]|uniref:Uncharacterized protein n=1 Tax=Paenisporosarcina macmurdoensis TaxID=212659 RepID=A0ABW1L2Y0_9BACL
MFKTIDWRIFINTTTKEKAQRIITRLSEEVGEIETLSLEPYWKDKTKYELVCKTKLQIAEPENAVFFVLQLASHLGNEIKVMGPFIYEENHITFEGLCSSPKIVGLSWFHFNIDNY